MYQATYTTKEKTSHAAEADEEDMHPPRVPNAESTLEVHVMSARTKPVEISETA